MSEKITEGVPPIEKRSMVSEADIKETVEKIKEVLFKEGTVAPSVDVLLLFAIEKLHDINENLRRIADAFEGAKQQTTIEKKTEEQQPKPIAPETVFSPVAEPAESRVNEIVKAFEPIKELVRIDVEASAQFVLVYPSGFLGADKFAKVGAVSRTLGGEYVSQGKRSHFKIPRLAKQTKLAKEDTKTSKLPSSPINDVKALFPEELESMLKFEEKDGDVKISPRQFLGSENFAKIASIVRGIGGSYVSQGRESHFKVSIKKA